MPDQLTFCAICLFVCWQIHKINFFSHTKCHPLGNQVNLTWPLQVDVFIFYRFKDQKYGHLVKESRCSTVISETTENLETPSSIALVAMPLQYSCVSIGNYSQPCSLDRDVHCADLCDESILQNIRHYRTIAMPKWITLYTSPLYGQARYDLRCRVVLKHNSIHLVNIILCKKKQLKKTASY